MSDLVHDLTARAARDTTLDDDAYLAVTRALRGLDPITGDPAPRPAVPVRTPHLPVVRIDLAEHRTPFGDFTDPTHRLDGYDGPDADGHVAYIGRTGLRHDELPRVIAWLTAIYHAATPHQEEQS